MDWRPSLLLLKQRAEQGGRKRCRTRLGLQGWYVLGTAQRPTEGCRYVYARILHYSRFGIDALLMLAVLPAIAFFLAGCMDLNPFFTCSLHQFKSKFRDELASSYTVLNKHAVGTGRHHACSIDYCL